MNKLDALYQQNLLTIEDYFLSQEINHRNILSGISKKLDGVDELKIIPLLQKTWNERINTENEIEIGYYNSLGDFLSITYADVIFSPNTEINKETLTRHQRTIEGSGFVHCQPGCRFYYIKPLASNNFKMGYLQSSTPITHLIDKVLYRLDNFDAFLLYEDNENLKVGYASRNIFLDKIKEKLNIRKSGSSIIKSNDSSFVILTFAVDGYKNLKTVLSKDITKDESENQNFLRWQILKITVILFLMILLSRIILKKSVIRINYLSTALSAIASGRFKKVSTDLKKKKRDATYDEIDVIHKTTIELTDQLDQMHAGLQEKISEISFMANYDSLTKVCNRRYFNEKLEEHHSLKKPFILIGFDLNHFKIINDSLGHATGDQLLIQFSSSLNNTFSSHGFVGRMGGDEFSAVIYGDDRKLVLKLVGELTSLLENIKIKGIHSTISTSSGASVYPGDSLDLEEIKSFADAAMYENKRLKIHAINFYNGNEKMIVEEKESQKWRALINDNLKRKSIELYCQPIFYSNTDEIFSYEILSRVLDGDNIVYPKDFISYLVGELAVQFDQVIFEKLLSFFKEFNDTPNIMFNLSCASLISADLSQFIITSVAKYNFNPRKLTIEITENIEINDFPKAKSAIESLRREGVRFALDDFGKGYSSLSYLAELSIDYLKIDKKFIRGLAAGSKKEHSIVRAIEKIAQEMNIEIIAEGIENESCKRVTESYKFDYLQGYVLQKPFPLEYLNYQ